RPSSRSTRPSKASSTSNGTAGTHPPGGWSRSSRASRPRPQLSGTTTTPPSQSTAPRPPTTTDPRIGHLGALLPYLAARLLDELAFELAWAAGADRPSGGALAGGEAALISLDAKAAPVLNAKTCEVRRGCLAHDSSRIMPRRRSAADHAERAMLFLT